MTQILEFKQRSHLDPALTNPATRGLHADKLIGRWVNTNRETRGIAECTITQDGGHFNLRVAGVGAEGPIAWPSPATKVLANLEEEAGQRALALAATFDFSFMRAETYLRVNKGVLVIVLYATFHDDSGRSNYVNREFFDRID